MKRITQISLWLFMSMHAPVALSTDACSTRAILTVADVTVSDGARFKTESFFHSKDSSAIRHIRDDERLIVVEGPLGWTRAGDKAESGSNFHKLFALGHQFHAFLLHFEEIVTNVRRNEQIDFRNDIHSGKSGEYPYGGVVHLIDGVDGAQPAGLLFELPETSPITVTFDDWREEAGRMLPYELQIDDGERTFDYHYSNVDSRPRPPLWFFDTISAPPIDQVQIYRLHRKLLAAHCLGDAELIAGLTAPEIILANRGRLEQSTSDATREQFAKLFQHQDYTEYHDIAMPVIEVSRAADLGWVAVNVRAVGSDKRTSDSFDDQWAWLMVVKKIDNVWVHAGNASNLAE